MIDHCSFSWGSDEAISTRSWSGKPSNNITFQRILIAESKTGSLMGNGDDFDMAENQSTHKNLFFNVNHRFPNVQSNGRMDIINNVVYDWGARLCNLFGRSSINYINNYHGLGYKRPFSVIPDGKSKPLNMIAYDSGDLDIYAKGNYIEDVFTDLDADNKTLFYVWGPDDGYAQNKLANSSNFTESMHTLIGNPLPILSATENFEDVVNNVGANAYIDNTGNVVTSIDAIDREYLEIIKSGGYERFRDDNGEYIFRNYARYINFHANVNNVPINSRKENYDTDGDGMPDAWEIANNLNHLVKDALGDINDNGYTNLEEFFNIVDK
jgi:hypothetical protein